MAHAWSSFVVVFWGHFDLKKLSKPVYEEGWGSWSNPAS